MRRKLEVEQLESRLAMDVAIGTVMPTFQLVDTNTASQTYNAAVSPEQVRGEVSAWYFAHATCGYCTAQFGYLDELQQELASTYPLLKIKLFGVNEIINEIGNPQITQGRTIPWLQDVDANQNGESDVWSERWQVEFRDVVIVNGRGEKTDVYNLTSHNLAVRSNYTELKEKLIDAALLSQLPFQNATRPNDVDGDTGVGPLDALLILNDLNDNGARKLAAPQGSTPIDMFLDTTGDGHVSPLDALYVINELNASYTAAAQGEPEPPLSIAATMSSGAESSAIQSPSVVAPAAVDLLLARYLCYGEEDQE